MAKKRYVRNLHKARTSNARQLHSLKLLLSGLDIDKSNFTPNVTESVFGRWFYDEAVPFLSECCRQCLNGLEANMVEFHDHYGKIYALYYGRQSAGVLGLLRMKRKITQTQIEAARRHYEEMLRLGDRLRQQLNLMHAFMDTLPDEAFATRPLMQLQVTHECCTARPLN